jgi:hypothetical protein
MNLITGQQQYSGAGGTAALCAAAPSNVNGGW